MNLNRQNSDSSIIRQFAMAGVAVAALAGGAILHGRSAPSSTENPTTAPSAESESTEVARRRYLDLERILQEATRAQQASALAPAVVPEPALPTAQDPAPQTPEPQKVEPIPAPTPVTQAPVPLAPPAPRGPDRMPRVEPNADRQARADAIPTAFDGQELDTDGIPAGYRVAGSIPGPNGQSVRVIVPADAPADQDLPQEIADPAEVARRKIAEWRAARSQ